MHPWYRDWVKTNEVITILKKINDNITQFNKYQRQMETGQNNLERRLSPITKSGNRLPKQQRGSSPDSERKPYQGTLPRDRGHRFGRGIGRGWRSDERSNEFWNFWIPGHFAYDCPERENQDESKNIPKRKVTGEDFLSKHRATINFNRL